MASDAHSTPTDCPPTTTRRALATLSGAGLAALFLSPDPKWSTPPRAADNLAEHPDARLVRLCAAYIEAVNAYNAPAARDPDALRLTIENIQDQAADCPARTVAGVAAKARVARHLAQQRDGFENYSDAYTGDWPEQVVRDLLRLAGEG